jgi:hypothetical protein
MIMDNDQAWARSCLCTTGLFRDTDHTALAVRARAGRDGNYVLCAAERISGAERSPC